MKTFVAVLFAKQNSMDAARNIITGQMHISIELLKIWSRAFMRLRCAAWRLAIQKCHSFNLYSERERGAYSRDRYFFEGACNLLKLVMMMWNRYSTHKGKTLIGRNESKITDNVLEPLLPFLKSQAVDYSIIRCLFVRVAYIGSHYVRVETKPPCSFKS